MSDNTYTDPSLIFLEEGWGFPAPWKNPNVVDADIPLPQGTKEIPEEPIQAPVEDSVDEDLTTYRELAKLYNSLKETSPIAVHTFLKKLVALERDVITQLLSELGNENV